ncbi:SsrA-binding protein [Elusimicrobium minutum Pei191]|uniref:SsrA-binding protein n=1 Tax=Elusimicrobium minutum (strain Pei191) TaxID=445932 RepID=SSRP_ELUMP|nr:SsrA-binding protein SmpB [Elusimicrobium minutum]B2KCF8.1 RecName: Full=SsrA-binding protein; AltName: Full=Small protein B [Elusimicrobium minutum Pei191]ACC98079.1 SsrA-binding protein [Elusimicrobium minutum Pei191]
MAKKDNGPLVAATNRKAYHNYHILDTYEAGIELLGSEVKSIRKKEVSLDGAFVRIEGMQAYVFNMHINPYKYNTVTEVEPLRQRRLLLNKKEINKLKGHAEIKGHTIIPLEVYFKNGWAKIKVGLGKGKQLFDKRDAIKKRDLSREMEKDFKNKIKF